MTLHSSHSIRSPRARLGFSLVEVMVAMVIGLLAMLVTLQVYALFEGQKRTTTGGADALNNGVIALSGLQNDLQQSGYGISALNLLGCSVGLPGGASLSALAPVTINAAAITGQDANTDTLLVVYGSGNGSPEGDTITTQPATNTYAVATPTSFSVNDKVIATPQARATPCALGMEAVTSVSVGNSTASVASGVAGMTNGALYNVGAAPVVHAYAIRNGNLTMCDYTVNDCGNAANNTVTTIWTPVANNIVSLRAQYGRDTTAGTMDGIVDGFDQTVATPPTVTSTQCGWARVSAVSVALLARSTQPEKPTSAVLAVTTMAPTWAGSVANSAVPAVLSGAPFTLTATSVPGNFTWQNFRYKVFQTTVPLRNISWKGVQTGC